jgi:hypothetical protein
MRGTPTVRRSFNGGLNTLDAVFDLDGSEARDLRNMLPTTRGAVKKRPGTQDFLTSPGYIPVSMYPSQLPRALVVTGTTFISAISAAGTATAVVTGLSNNRRWQFINAPANGGQGPVYGMNGVDAAYVSSTTTGGLWTASAGTLPVGQYLTYNQRRALIAGMTSYTTADPASTVVASNLGNPRDFTIGTNQAWAVEFDPQDGEQITGLGSLGPYVLVFKPSKTWLIYDLDSGANRRIGQNIGCVAPRSIVETPQGTFFLSKDQGVMIATENSVKSVSDKILPTIQALAPSQVSLAIGAFWNKHYYLSASSGGSVNDLTFDYDFNTGTWWLHSLGSTDMAVWQPSTQPLLYDLRPSAQNIRRLYVPGIVNDNTNTSGAGGTAFSAYIKPGHEYFGLPDVKKRVTEISVNGAGHCRVALSKDFAPQESQLAELQLTTTAGAGVYGTNDGSFYGVNDGNIFGPSSPDIGMKRIPTPGAARIWGFNFINDYSDTFELDSFTLAYRVRKD